MSREAMLKRIRAALGERPTPQPPPVRLRVTGSTVEERIASFTAALEAVSGKVFVAADAGAARDYVLSIVAGREFVASNAPVLRDLGFTALDGREACASAAVGITGATYGLADTGSLVMLASEEEPRLVSLLPPVHIAFLARDRILSGLDELFVLVPEPASVTSSMVLITGPSRTADIEQILVRGVHGPGELYVVIL